MREPPGSGAVVTRVCACMNVRPACTRIRRELGPPPSGEGLLHENSVTAGPLRRRASGWVTPSPGQAGAPGDRGVTPWSQGLAGRRPQHGSRLAGGRREGSGNLQLFLTVRAN